MIVVSLWPCICICGLLLIISVNYAYICACVGTNIYAGTSASGPSPQKLSNVIVLIPSGLRDSSTEWLA